jgi:Fe-S-cluster containining protein
MIKQDGFDFSFDEHRCATCEGNCCIGESGYIWVSPKEMVAMAEHLNLELSEFKKQSLDKIGYKYSIKEQKIADNNYACIFFDLTKKQCSVYEVRPTQCRTFPFWEHFKTNPDEVKEECPAIIF